MQFDIVCVAAWTTTPWSLGVLCAGGLPRGGGDDKGDSGKTTLILFGVVVAAIAVGVST